MADSRKSLRKIGLGLMAPVAASIAFWLIDRDGFFKVFLKTGNGLLPLFLLLGTLGMILLLTSWCLPTESRPTSKGTPKGPVVMISIGSLLMAPLALLLVTAAAGGHLRGMMAEAFIWPVMLGMVAFVGFIICTIGFAFRLSR